MVRVTSPARVWEGHAVRCSKCKAEPPAEANFCPTCGQALRNAAAVTRPQYQQPRSYTPRHLVDKILTSRSSIEGERKLVTVMFADVAGFTPMSEKLDPEDVHQIMDACFRILMDKVHEYEGTINEKNLPIAVERKKIILTLKIPIIKV